MPKDVLVVVGNSNPEIIAMVKQHTGTTVLLFDERRYNTRFINYMENLFLRTYSKGGPGLEFRARLLVGDDYRLPEGALENSGGDFDYFLSKTPEFKDAILCRALEEMLPLLSALTRTKGQVWIVGDVQTSHHNLTLYGGFLFSNPAANKRLTEQTMHVVTHLQLMPEKKIALLVRGARLMGDYGPLPEEYQILISGASLEVEEDPDPSVTSVEMVCRKHGYLWL